MTTFQRSRECFPRLLTFASLAREKAQAAEMELFSLIINQKADLSLDLVVVFHRILTSQLSLNLNVNSDFFHSHSV